MSDSNELPLFEFYSNEGDVSIAAPSRLYAKDLADVRICGGTNECWVVGLPSEELRAIAAALIVAADTLDGTLS